MMFYFKVTIHASVGVLMTDTEKANPIHGRGGEILHKGNAETNLRRKKKKKVCEYTELCLKGGKL